MIGYVLLFILFAGSWTLFGFGVEREEDWQLGVGMFFGLITLALFATATIELASRHSDAVSFESDRNYQQELIYSISDTMSPQTINKILSGATNINERIERNRKHCNSKMWGFMYNKEIAEVEPIDIPKLKYQIIFEENASEE